MSANAIGKYSPLYPAAKPRAAERATQRDRRSATRTSVHWPVILRQRHGEILETITENISSRGFYCLSRSPITTGEVLLCCVTVPTHDPAGTNDRVILECNVRVVRSESTSDEGLYGVACRIENYRFACAESMPV